ncbi:hypothetical protein [Pseudoleptotrichia goodfellowii]|uniref:Uncharacterized protein n=1 Tax=Pseudoleptotrichia goodfellowii TaxID=157692 RepID=A0A510JB98_9FUSO|nr:hypothetical protein [Pseudoleptotrichia goodfellowii]BBM35403.1 hypothetical protein JCM16774_0315 [Pseudoleptotrichia goodfellowii]
MIELQDIWESIINETPFDYDDGEIVIVSLNMNKNGIYVTYKKFNSSKNHKKEFDYFADLEEWLENGDDEDEQ